ncbi:hypothetical protein AB6G19_05130 [Providencia manganoxydans]
MGGADNKGDNRGYVQGGGGINNGLNQDDVLGGSASNGEGYFNQCYITGGVAIRGLQKGMAEYVKNEAIFELSMSEFVELQSEYESLKQENERLIQEEEKTEQQ